MSIKRKKRKEKE